LHPEFYALHFVFSHDNEEPLKRGFVFSAGFVFATEMDKVNQVTKGECLIMKQEDLDYFKELLTNRLSELLNQADDTVSDMNNPKDNFPDPTDRATYEADRNFELRIRDREHKLIKKVKKALDRIDNGTFGICEKCGDDISIERLKARPVTTLCIECKTKEEALERALGL
jgi:DnaK suppressor protein